MYPAYIELTLVTDPILLVPSSIVLRSLVGLRGIGNSVRRYIGYGYGLVRGREPSRALVLTSQH
jgi:hypothetical protein